MCNLTINGGQSQLTQLAAQRLLFHSKLQQASVHVAQNNEPVVIQDKGSVTSTLVTQDTGSATSAHVDQDAYDGVLSVCVTQETALSSIKS